jgi:hypothetical protein
MHSEIFQQTITWTPILSLAALAAILLRRQLARNTPFFLAFVVVAWARDAACYVAERMGPHVYFRMYWISHIFSAIFIFLASYELSFVRLFPRFYKVAFYRSLFAIAAVVTIAVAFSTMAGDVHLAMAPRIINVFDLLHVVGLFFFVGLMSVMGRNWSRYEFVIAFGLGIQAATFIIFFATYLRSGGPVQGIIGSLPAISDAVSSVVWLVAFLMGKKADEFSTGPVAPSVLQDARQWESTLRQTFLNKK